MLTAGLGRGGEEGRGPEGADLEAELGSQVEEEVWASIPPGKGLQVAGAGEPADTAGWCRTEVSGMNPMRAGGEPERGGCWDAEDLTTAPGC